MRLLRFTGQIPVSFMALPYLGEVEPGEFEARDADAEALLLRDDVEAVKNPGPAEVSTVEADAPSKPRKASAAKSPEAPAADSSPTTTA